jgi:hypothetical protein
MRCRVQIIVPEVDRVKEEQGDSGGEKPYCPPDSVLSLGANDYVTKPINLALVQARIQTHLALMSGFSDGFSY